MTHDTVKCVCVLILTVAARTRERWRQVATPCLGRRSGTQWCCLGSWIRLHIQLFGALTPPPRE